MRKPKVEEAELLAGLMSVLRAKGYDGASLNELAASSGLQKASLYHRFPGGKKEIAQAVLDYVGEWVNLNIYHVLANSAVKPQKRLDTALQNIRTIYSNGEETCLLRALSMDSGLNIFGDKIHAGMDRWIEGFTKLGLDLDLSQEMAKQQATQVLILVQGGLVVSKGLDTLQPFEMALLNVKKLYFGS